MKRTAIQQMHEWKTRPNRKPLIVHGARQVGKTWLMKEFASIAYERAVYINFEEDEHLRSLFQNDFDVNRILTALQLNTGVEINDQTLLILDEIQEAPRGLTALKYLYEKAPHLHIMAAGSLLGIAMHEKVSFPVGKVDFMSLYPLSFIEYLDAVGMGDYAALIEHQDWQMLTTFRQKMIDALRHYYYIGGMPEVVDSFAKHKDFDEVRRLQKGILSAYDRDFSKHAPIHAVPRIRMVWESIHTQLAKENRKYIYGLLRDGARAKDFELAIEWLVDAGLVYRVNRVKAGKMPLSAYTDFDAFKLYMLDTGLLAAMANIPAQTLIAGHTLFTDYKGAFTEQYVLQQLKTCPDLPIYYWSAENSRGEIDFIVQKQADIIPIEVKAEENLRSKSLRCFVESNSGLHGLRFSMSDYRQQGWMTNIPLYAITQAFSPEPPVSR